MALIYIYQASDFTTGLPAESGDGTASGTGPWTLTLSPTAQPIIIEITDNDANFEETDATQTLASDVTINGVTYTAGTKISGAYSLTNSTSGDFVTGFQIGSGVDALSYTGAVQGVMSSTLLDPGQTYTFNQENSTYTNPVPYSSYVACFTGGTMIDTPDGPRPVESLKAGDLVLTRDNGVQTIRWAGSRTVAATGQFAPVVFMPGALGNPCELAVSPQHRMLVEGWRCELLFGEAEVLAPAVHLVNGDTIYRREGGQVCYHHLLFDRHEIIFANGAASESFHPEERAVNAFERATRDELLSLFPELAVKGRIAYGPTARRVLKQFEASALFA